MNVRADLTYAQGLERVWSYRTRYDFFNPEFANLGEQAVLNKEIMADCPDGTGTGQKGRCVWISGAIWGRALFQVDGYWTYAAGCDRHFGGLESYGAFSSIPTLGSTFIQSNVPLDRVITVPSEPHFIADVYFKEKWARVMPTFGVPGLQKL